MNAKLTRIALNNWRNFKKVELPLGKRLFVVGPNASGKTNLLDAIRFLRDIAAPGGSLIRAIADRRGLKHLRSLHAGMLSNVLVEVEMEVEGARWRYTLELAGSETGKKPLRIAQETVVHGDQPVLARPNAADKKDERLLTQTHLEQISQNAKFRPLADALASVVHIHVVPQVARTPARAEEFSKKDAPGSDFIDQLAKLPNGRQRSTLARIEKSLRIAVPRFSELKVTRDDVGRPHLEAKYEHWRRRGGWQNEQEFSDGTLRLIGLLWAIDAGASPLLLDEPELSLHKEVVRQIPRLLAQAADRSERQIFVSTHSAEMLTGRGIDLSEIAILFPSEYETNVSLGSAQPELIGMYRSGVPLERIVMSMTKPNRIEQLSLSMSGGSRR